MSIHLSMTGITWARFALQRKESNGSLQVFQMESVGVTGWGHYLFSEADQKKAMHITDLLQVVLECDARMPEANIYVLESPPNAMKSRSKPTVNQINIKAEQSQLVGLMTAILSKRSNSAEKPHVFFMTRNLSARCVLQLGFPDLNINYSR